MKLVVLALLASTGLAHADGGTVRGVVEVARPIDVPASTVMVYLVGFTEKAPPEPVEVRQVGRLFIPDLLGLTAGQTVAFPNGDPFLHNVFSPTSDRTFDLGSYKKGDVRARTFPDPGVIDVYCNIHPEMSATLLILPNTKFAYADPAGHFEIANVPPGTWSLFAYTRRVAKPVSVQVTVTAGVPVEAKLRLDEVQRDFAHRNKFGETYRDTTIYKPGA